MYSIGAKSKGARLIKAPSNKMGLIITSTSTSLDFGGLPLSTRLASLSPGASTAVRYASARWCQIYFKLKYGVAEMELTIVSK